jgi:chromosome partitioning protein
VNQKGGVGKTTTAVNLAACAAEDGVKTLIVDLDAQGNATSGLGMERGELEACMYDVLTSEEGPNGVEITDIVLETAVPNLFIAPATIDLAAADLSLSHAIAREMRLRRALERVAEAYELVIIDTGPSLGILTINSLCAADEVVIPIQCEYYALEGLSQLLDVIRLVKAQINPRLTVAGAVLTMYDVRTRLSAEVAEEVRRSFPGRVFETVIPRNVRLAEAPSYGMPVILYDPTCAGAQAYRQLYKEVLGDEEARAGQRTVRTDFGEPGATTGHNANSDGGD